MLVTLRRRNFALLWFGGLISETGDWLLVIGLPVYVYLLTGSVLQTSILFMVEQLPTILLGSVAGVFVDRWDRRRTLLIGNAIQGAVLLSLLAVRSADQLWLVYVVALIESVAAQFIGPAVNALLPRLVDEEHIVSANSLVGINNNLARLVGSPLGGVIVGFWSLTGVVLLDSASFFLAMLMILGVSATSRRDRGPKPEESHNPWGTVWQEWVNGLALIRRSRTLTVLFSVVVLQAAAQGIFLVLYVVWVLNVLHAGATGVGWLRGIQAIGGLLGGLTVGWLGGKVRAPLLITVGTIAFGVIELGIWNSPSLVRGLVISSVLFIAVGLPGAAYGAGLATMLQTSVEDAYLGRIFGAFNAAFAVLLLVGMGVSGTLSDRLGVLVVLNAQALLYVLTGVLALALLPRE
jgi:MFS family permease